MNDTRGKKVTKADAIYVYRRQARFFRVGEMKEKDLKKYTVKQIMNMCETMYFQQSRRKRARFERMIKKSADKVTNRNKWRFWIRGKKVKLDHDIILFKNSFQDFILKVKGVNIG